MTYQLKIAASIVTAVLFTGCGGGSGGSADAITSYTTEELLAFDVINLYHNTDPELCNQSLWNNAGDTFQDLTVGQISSDITCVDFESVDPDITCLEIDYAELYAQAGQSVPSNAITCAIAYNRGE